MRIRGSALGAPSSLWVHRPLFGCTVLSLGAPSSVWVHRPLFVLRAGRGIAYMQGHTVHAVMSRDQLLHPSDLLKCPDSQPREDVLYVQCN